MKFTSLLQRPDFDNGMKTPILGLFLQDLIRLQRPDFDNGMKTIIGYLFIARRSGLLQRPDFDNGMKTTPKILSKDGNSSGCNARTLITG